jgi:hypothetical protein
MLPRWWAGAKEDLNEFSDGGRVCPAGTTCRCAAGRCHPVPPVRRDPTPTACSATADRQTEGAVGPVPPLLVDPPTTTTAIRPAAYTYREQELLFAVRRDWSPVLTRLRCRPPGEPPAGGPGRAGRSYDLRCHNGLACPGVGS